MLHILSEILTRLNISAISGSRQKPIPSKILPEAGGNNVLCRKSKLHTPIHNKNSVSVTQAAYKKAVLCPN